MDLGRFVGGPCRIKLWHPVCRGWSDYSIFDSNFNLRKYFLWYVGEPRDWVRGEHFHVKKKVWPVKPYRTPPFSNSISSARRKCCWVEFGFLCKWFYLIIRSLYINDILHVKHLIPNLWIYRNVIPKIYLGCWVWWLLNGHLLYGFPQGDGQLSPLNAKMHLVKYVPLLLHVYWWWVLKLKP